MMAMTGGKFANGFAALGLLCALALAGCASSAEQRRLEYRVNQLRIQSGTDAPRDTLGDLRAELQTLEGEVARLTGRVETLEHRLSRALEAGTLQAPTGALELGTPVGEVRVPTVPAVPSSPTAPTSSPEGVSASLVPESAPVFDESAEVVENALADESAHTREALETLQASRRNAPTEAVVAFQRAYAHWLDDDNELCIEHFGRFLQDYPASTYAEDAHYWRADCYFRSGDLTASVLSFNKVVADYAQSARAPDALYRMGEALLALGPSRECAAVRAFERVAAEYPNSPRAQQATSQLQVLTVSCPPAPTANATPGERGGAQR